MGILSQTFHPLTETQLVSLRREKLLAEGRHDAFIFVLEHQRDADCLPAEIQHSEELIARGTSGHKGPMAPNASPRVYQEGYLAGLRDALTILTQTTNGSPSIAVIEPTQTAPTPPRTETADTQRELRAEREESATSAVTAPSSALAPPSE